MMVLKMFAFIFLIVTDANSMEWPKPNQENCKFYDQLEEKLQCQKAGVNYLSQYAPFYCESFKAHERLWPGPLKTWAKKTVRCLQEMLYEHVSHHDVSCDQLEDVAFKTHSACYNQSDLCEMKPEDLVKIFQVIKIKDLMKEFRHSHIEIGHLIKTCFGKWLF